MISKIINEQPFISIVIPTLNSRQDIVKCLHFIRKLNYPKKYLEIIIWDNGSSDGTQAAVNKIFTEMRNEEWKSLTKIQSEHNLGVYTSRDELFKRIDLEVDYVLSLDDDVFLPRDSLTTLLGSLQNNPRAGIIGPRTVYESEQGKTAHGAGFVNLYIGRYSEDDADSLIECDYVIGCCLLGSPMMICVTCANSKTTHFTKNVRLFISGSAPLLEETFAEFEQRTGKAILERYGMTETGMNTSNPLNGQRIAGTVGFPLPGTDVRIMDENGQPCATDGVGSLQVKGPNVFQGYWRMPEKTAEEFTDDGFFVTGDLGTINADGYVSIVGRSKDLIISGGYNIYPKEIEMVLNELPGVLESAVFAFVHPDFGEGVAAAIVADGSANTITAESLTSVCREHLAGFKVPRRILFLDELPRNTMGKVQKNVLRDQYGQKEL